MSEKLPQMGEKQVESIGSVALSMLAIGLTAGMALIAAAKKLGETIEDSRSEQ